MSKGILATLKQLSFLDIAFRAKNIKITGGIRQHVHEYPHSPGGDQEPLGRKLYQVSCTAPFRADDKTYPTAWPGDLGLLRTQFEQQTKGDLVIPTMGTIKARCNNWVEDQTAQVMNGVDMNLEFIELADTVMSTDQPLVVTYKDVSSKAGALSDAVATAVATSSITDTSDFDNLQTLASQVTDDPTSANCQQLADTCRLVDADNDDLDLPENFLVMQAVIDLGVTADNVNRDLLRQNATISTFILTQEMSIVNVSIALYGDSSQWWNLLDLNRDVIDGDVFALPELTELRYYDVVI